ncbi:MAG TPA: DUF4142 domain-containing protein [Acidobacteriaceae bacterium]|nr:DUF4142 domain-containing protein [Acidobacteriaceae bacterium]
MMRSFFTFPKIGLMAVGLFLMAPTVMLAQKGDTQEVLAHLYRNTNVETNLSKMAMKNSTNADVKKFAHQVMSDDRNAGGELMEYAMKYNLRLIAEAPASTVEAEKQMKKLTGEAFDKMYLVQMDAFVKDDQKTAAQASAISDSEVSAIGTKIQNLASDRAKQITALTTGEGFQIQ